MQAPALQHTRLASPNLRKHPSRHPRALRLIVSASQQSKSLLKLQIAFSTEFGDSLAIVDSKSGWESEKVGARCVIPFFFVDTIPAVCSIVVVLHPHDHIEIAKGRLPLQKYCRPCWCGTSTCSGFPLTPVGYSAAMVRR